MPSEPAECASSGKNPNNGAPTCVLELDSIAVPSIQYQCNSNQPSLSSVMVHATDPQSGITAPFKLEPGKSCQDICSYTLGTSGFTVGDITIKNNSVRIGNNSFTPDPFLCKPE